MSALNHNPPIPADATRLAGEAYRTEIKAGETRLAGDGDRSILAIQLGAQTSAAAAERYKIGDRIGGRYEVLAIHRGSMGVVYGTFDHETQMPRALKTLQERFFSKRKLRDLFSEEASAWVKLGKHPYIVRAYLVEKYEGRPYVITEYIRGEVGMGGDLLAWLGHRRLTLKLAVEMALQVAQGMQHAVRTIPGFIHRDLKPANILVDNRARAMVTDFGLVCATEVEAGTPAYMAPELWSGETPATRTDIYAFGCILYEMLTGHRMFSAGSVDQWRIAHLAQTPIAPSALLPDIPEETSAFVMKCLAKTISARPHDWDEVVNELAALFSLLTGQPAVLDFSAYELTADELISASYSLGELGKYQEMISAGDRALKIDPAHANAAIVWSNKALALNNLKRHDEAIACCDRALDINPKMDDAWSNKARALTSLEHYDEAIACCDRALKIVPNSAKARINKASALNYLKRLSSAN